MEEYLEIIVEGFAGYWNYLVAEVTFNYDYKPKHENYFYWLIGISLVVYGLELINPWRKSQKPLRKDFWKDVFYMFFNFFLFSLIVFHSLSMVGAELFNDFLALFNVTNLVALEIDSWPPIWQYLLLFVLADFLQWNIHRLLHRIPFLWQFHKVHHSVKEMGFAAHLRFHWMETIIYKTLQYIPLAMIGYGITEFFFVHMISLLIGHLNHANVGWDYGPFKYILNNPKMHIWHHAKALPNKYGVNFGLSLSVWDYLFGTAYLPKSGKDIELGFEGEEYFPEGLAQQLIYPLTEKKHEE